MPRFAIIADGGHTCLRYSLEQAAEKIAGLHRDGRRWDARTATRGQGYRLLTPTEAEALVAAVAEEIR